MFYIGDLPLFFNHVYCVYACATTLHRLTAVTCGELSGCGQIQFALESSAWLNEDNSIVYACGWCQTTVHEAYTIFLASLLRYFWSNFCVSLLFYRSLAVAELFSASHFCKPF
jgi:hypothetical protein